jgi:hypothetical protein
MLAGEFLIHGATDSGLVEQTYWNRTSQGDQPRFEIRIGLQGDSCPSLRKTSQTHFHNHPLNQLLFHEGLKSLVYCVLHDMTHFHHSRLNPIQS